MPTTIHDCSDPYCPKNGRATCAICDDCGPVAAPGAEPCASCQRAPLRRSAVSILKKDDRFLCVWNNRFHGWAFPGGMVEAPETTAQAQERELLEETGLVTTARVFAYCADLQKPSHPDRSSHVHVFFVTTTGTPVAKEPGCPIGWLTLDEFLQQSPFVDFYKTMFEQLRRSLLIC